MNGHPRFAALFTRVAAGTYLTLDCRSGVHGACETCSCECHNVGIEGRDD